MIIAPTKRNWAATNKTKVKARPHATIVAGKPGVGKTELVAHFKDVLFAVVGQEDGISQLKSIGRVPESVVQTEPIKTFEDACDLVQWLTNEPHNFKTVAFDVLSSLEELLHTYHANKNYKGVIDKKFKDFNNGAKEDIEQWKEFINMVDKMRDERNVGAVFLSHTALATAKNPDGANYDKWVLNVNPFMAEQIIGWADNVLFCDYVVDVSVRGGDSVHKKGKATGGDVRWLYGTYRPTFEGKNRLGITAEGVDMGTSGAEGYRNLGLAVAAGKSAAGSVEPQQ